MDLRRFHSEGFQASVERGQELNTSRQHGLALVHFGEWLDKEVIGERTQYASPEFHSILIGQVVGKEWSILCVSRGDNLLEEIAERLRVR